MTTVRQTVTTVQQSSHGGHGAAPGLDNSLDALLEDLQSSVAGRGGAGGAAPAVNGLGSSSYRREVKRTVERDAPQVTHLSPANPTTVVAERSASPLLPAPAPGEQRSMMYKTYSYQTYHTSSSGDARAATLPASSSASVSTVSTASAAADPTSDARLQQNLHELDNLLVDLRHAQRAGFEPPPAPTGSTTTTRTEVVTKSGGVDPGLLEPVGHSTPARHPGQQHVSRVEYKQYRTEQRHHSAGSSPAQRYVQHVQQPESPRPQPKRSSSAQRELVYGSEHVSRQRRRSPSPQTPPRREFVEARDRYREKSPSHQRLQREVLYNETTTTTTSSSGRSPGRYRTPSPPPPQRAPRGQSPDYSPGGSGGGTTRVTTVRTYNYGSGGGSGSGSGRRSPSPQRPPYRSPSPVAMSRPPFQPGDEPARSPSPNRRVHTVHTYQYDHQGPLTYHVTQHKRYAEEQPLLPRPFPTPSPTPPSPAQPPKRLDDLMASFGDTGEQRDGPPGGYYRSEKVTTTTTTASGRGPGDAAPPPAPASNGTAVALATNAKVKDVARERAPTTNQAGPPVYYPPGVEMFAQKEESAMQMSGKAKERGKYKYEYGSKEKSRQVQTEGKLIVPGCLPLCCACNII